MSTLRENFYKSRGLGVNPLSEDIESATVPEISTKNQNISTETSNNINDNEKVSLAKAIKLLSSYKEEFDIESKQYEMSQTNPYSKMIDSIVKDLQSIQQKIEV
jgi:hypothetical protein